MKKLIILIIALIILLIGGVWWWFARTDDTALAPPRGDPSIDFPVNPPITASGDDGGLVVNPPSPLGAGSPSGQNDPSRVSSQLINLSQRVVSGAIILRAATSTATDEVIFLERDTGLIVKMNLADKTPRQIARVSARAPIESVLWSKNGDQLLFWFKTLMGAKQNYFSGNVNLAATTSDLELPEIIGETLNPQPERMALSPDGKRLFVLERVGEETIGKVLDLKTGKNRLIFTSRLNQWLTAWPENNLIALANKPSNRAASYLYLLAVDQETEKRVLGGNGLLALVSPDGQKILYSRGTELNLRDRASGENRVLAISTLAEKCVWSADSTMIYCAVPRTLPAANYPDDWLAGEITFDDLLWRIDGATGIGRLIWAGEPGLGDAINLLIADGGEKLVFTDRWSGQLYLLPELMNRLADE